MSKFKTYGIFSTRDTEFKHPLYHDGEEGWWLNTEGDFERLFYDSWNVPRGKVGTLKIPMEYLK